MEHILCRLSTTIVSAINGTDTQRRFIPYVVRDLTKLESRPRYLADMAYGWCSAICENRQHFQVWESLLLSLEIGFRHLGMQSLRPTGLDLAHTERHQGLVDVVFESSDGEAIADYLHVTVEGMNVAVKWTKLLLDIVQSPEGAQHLPQQYWELLVGLVVSGSQWLEGPIAGAYNPQITKFLAEAQEWSKLECWMGTVWVLWPPGVDGTTDEDLDHSMFLLFRHRPGALQKLEQWMERWGRKCGRDVPGSFQQICERAREAAQRDAP